MLRKFLPVVTAALVSGAFAGVSFSQVPDSAAFAASYWPLQIGNVWQYSYNSNVGSSEQSGWYRYREVIGDTLMPNGHVYQVVRTEDNDPARFIYSRVDTLSGTVFEYNLGWARDLGLESSETPKMLLPFSQAARTSNWSHGSMTCGWSGSGSMFSETYDIWKCWESSGRISNRWSIVQGLGITVHVWTSNAIFHWTLIHAKIEGETMGTLVSAEELPDATSLSPVEVYPNPILRGSFLTIEGLEPSQPTGVVDIVDSLGRSMIKVQAQGRSSLRIQLDAQLTPGVYFVRATDGTRSVVRPIIIR